MGKKQRVKAGQKRSKANAKIRKKKLKHDETAFEENEPKPVAADVDEATDSPDEPSDNESQEGLFDNLDEQMDPSALDEVLQQLEEEDDSAVNEDEDDNTSTPEPEDHTSASEHDTSDKDRVMSLPEKPKFRDYYMEQMTRAFGSALDAFRQEPNFNSSRLTMLIDSLEAGIDIFSELEQEIVMADAQRNRQS